MMRLVGYAIACFLLVAATAGAVPLNINAYVDDFATITIDGVLKGSYNNAAAAGNITFIADLTPGWHDIAIDYANQAGTNFLALQEQYPGDPGLSFIPLSAFRSLNQSSTFISGLRADYYGSLGGSFLFTVYGEGPIDNGALSFTSEIYEGSAGLWAGTFGPSAQFEERLSGQLFVAGSPEPATLLPGLIALLILCFVRTRGLRCRAAAGC